MAAQYFLYRQDLVNGLVGGVLGSTNPIQQVLDQRAADGWVVHTIVTWTAVLVQILFAKGEPVSTINVAAPNVRVDAPVINVDAPQVTVEAPVVHIAAPQIDVHMPESAPAPVEVSVQGVTQPGRAMRTAPALKQGPRPR